MPEVKDFLDKFYKKVEKQLIQALEYVGEGFVADARNMRKEDGGFGDVTGNLRSSIGYFITKDGQVIKENVQMSRRGSDKATGLQTAKTFLANIKDNQGLRIYGIAGMDYAEEVESRGYNVITAQADVAIIELKEIINELKYDGV